MRRISIIGNLGKDGQLKQTNNGTDVINFTVAAKGGRKDDESIWHSCALFGVRAEKLAPFLKKGMKVFVRGEYKLREWSSNGKSGVDVDVTVDEIELLSPKKETEEGDRGDDPDAW